VWSEWRAFAGYASIWTFEAVSDDELLRRARVEVDPFGVIFER
jgi:hypothetical protein